MKPVYKQSAFEEVMDICQEADNQDLKLKHILVNEDEWTELLWFTSDRSRRILPRVQVDSNKLIINGVRILLED
jgi:hypothetical protein